MHKIVMEITFLITENHGKIMELCFLISVGTLKIKSHFRNVLQRPQTA